MKEELDKLIEDYYAGKTTDLETSKKLSLLKAKDITSFREEFNKHPKSDDIVDDLDYIVIGYRKNPMITARPKFKEGVTEEMKKLRDEFVKWQEENL